MSRAVSLGILVSVLAGPVWAAVIGEPKQPYSDRSDDVSRDHIETIGESRHAYSIRFAGTIDGTMTRMPIGYAAFSQGWQPNRLVLIENTGQTDVTNPRLVVNERGDWHTLESIVAEATRGYTSPADRARAIWEFVRRQRFHACTWDGECSDALKALNVYGYTLCGNQAQVITDLWRAAGLKTRRCYPIGHCVSEVFYDGGYHLLDSDEHVICLLRDNRSLASAEQIVRDHDLVKRTHTYGIGRNAGRRTDEFSASLYVYEGKREGEYPVATHHSMDLTLRPGESIEFRWDHIGKQYTAGTPPEKGQKMRDGLGDLLAGWGATAYDNLRNGKLRYEPDLSSPLAQRGITEADNVAFDTPSGQLKPTVAGKPAQVTWKFASPYVFVGGRAVAELRTGSGAAAWWSYSTDGKSWTKLPAASDSGNGRLTASIDEIVSPRRHPAYRFWLRLSLQGDTAVSDVAFEHDIQTSALGLPELTVGDNRVVYSDSSSGERQVRITHRWLERSAWHAPNPPAEAIVPKDEAVVEGTRVSFRWADATDPDGDKIADYQFELSEHPDKRWPLSPNFEKRISLTPFKGKPEWAVPYVGLLNPDTTYYWHVRALDATGVWGPWSRTFRFRTTAPGVPLDVRLVSDSGQGFTLTWKANPQGRAPVAYKVYGSDERGFSVSDTEYSVFRGKGFVGSIEEYTAKPAMAKDAGAVKTAPNLVARVSETRLSVVGSDLTLPNANRAFYRVVAIDAKGNESGPSGCAEVPRPFVCSRPPSPARVGVNYRYAVQVIRSIGDLRCRRSPTSSYNAAFWDREHYTFKPASLPEGLTIDPQTGVISGTLTRPGTVRLVFEVFLGTGQPTQIKQELQVTAP